MAAVTGFMKPGADSKEIHVGRNNNIHAGTLFNRAWTIGIPLMSARVVNTFPSCKGTEAPFKTGDETETQRAIGRCMIMQTNGVCFVKRNKDKVHTGGCDDCCQHPGHNCEGCTLMRDEDKFLLAGLEVSCKTCASVRGPAQKNMNKGNMSNMHWSGLSSTQEEMAPVPTSFDVHLESLSKEQMSAAVNHVCPLSGAFREAKRLREAESLSVLLEFEQDTTVHGKKQREQRAETRNLALEEARKQRLSIHDQQPTCSILSQLSHQHLMFQKQKPTVNFQFKKMMDLHHPKTTHPTPEHQMIC